MSYQLSKYSLRIKNFISFVIRILLKILRFLIGWKIDDEDISLAKIPQIEYRSENFIVLNKAFDVLINSNNSKLTTVQTQLRGMFPELVNPSLGHEFNFVHRLDYATSGLLCIALSKAACAVASQAFEKRLVNKFYLAIVRGHLSEEILDVNIAIGEDYREGSRGLRMLPERCSYAQKLRPAFTKILLLERGICQGYPATKVLLKPVTGRRHQLRLHLHELGHTIVGDYTHSNRRDTDPYRMYLHAFRLVLPTNLEKIDVQTADPFTALDPRNKWLPVEVINKLNSQAMKKILATC